MEDIKHGNSSVASFLACVGEYISERESRSFEEGLNTKFKLDIYIWLGKGIVSKVFDDGSKLLLQSYMGYTWSKCRVG